MIRQTELEPKHESPEMKDSSTTLADLKKLVADFVGERDWQPFHDPKNLSASIAIEAAELMEHFQWLRSDQLPSIENNPVARAAIEEELADIVAYVLSFATRMKIDLSSALEAKMRKNAEKYPADKFKGRFQ
ncbi:MAG: nucleotide pyrophosphohydrolase [Planctomycetota bacterium]